MRNVHLYFESKEECDSGITDVKFRKAHIGNVSKSLICNIVFLTDLYSYLYHMLSFFVMYLTTCD